MIRIVPGLRSEFRCGLDVFVQDLAPMPAGPGCRLYFTRRANVIVVLLTEGDKSTQKKDVRRALRIASEVGEET
jgi:putative addiction module killer protein